MISQDLHPPMSSQGRSSTTTQLSLEACAIEAAYSQACGHVERIYESETARHLRLQILILETENNELYEQLAQADGRIDELEKVVLDEGQERDAAIGQLDSVYKDLRIRNREVETIKAELTSLCGIKTDSTQLLTEKLTLARELSNLKPELDHLRSQNSTFQSLLSEKLSLQRQLSTLQVEIDNERRSKQRINAKDGKLHVEDGHLEASLEAVKAELTKEKREKSSADREAQKSLAALQNKITMYESRLDAFRGKLKNTKESLKEVQSELQRYQSASEHPTVLAQATSKGRKSQKRTASEMDADTMLGTPGDLGPGKSKRAKPTALGEKSTFSMTPFLSRTAKLRPESPFVGRMGEKQIEPEPIASSAPDETPTNQMRAESTVLMETGKKLLVGSEQEASRPAAGDHLIAEKSKKSSAKRPLKKPTTSPKLPHVAEEEVEAIIIADCDDPPRKAERAADFGEKADDGLDRRKVKRKMLGGNLGKTLFDEDEEEDALKGDRKAGPTRAFTKQKRRGLSELNANPETVGAFGPFSPLKKDRRAGPR